MAWAFWGLILLGAALVGWPVLLPVSVSVAMVSWTIGVLLLFATLAWGAWAWARAEPRPRAPMRSAVGLRLWDEPSTGELPWAA
jgi:hypothetical protein